ncbi:S8 family serine peptidase [Actinomadura craniellae]|nr:S8 family serine peptidase [Actinomadura craniellae]
MRVARSAVVIGCMAVLVQTASPVTAGAAPLCTPPKGSPRVEGESWAQRRLGFQRAWALTRGKGVTVAVIDSGVQPDHPMLAGRITEFVDLTGTGKRDCVGHGTGVAALAGGRDLAAAGVPLSGVAPEARLIVIKQQDADSDRAGGARLAKAIRTAADRRAKVINISITTGNSPELAQAVQYAQARDALIVTAAGNLDGDGRSAGPAYPASYPGVLSVASLGPAGAVAGTSDTVTRADVGAPGAAVPTAWTGGYHPGAEGTSFAAAYVSGTAALVRSYHPELDHRQILHRIRVTADGNVGQGSGRGMINPVAAVTAVISGEGPAGPPGGRVELAAPAPADHRTRGIALAVTGTALLLAGIAALGGIFVPMGRRRGWRPSRAAPVTANTAVSEEGDDEPQARPVGTIGA